MTPTAAALAPQRSRLIIHVGRRPHMWAGVVGLLVGGVTLVACLLGLAHQYERELAEGQKASVDRITAIFSDSIEVLHKLNTGVKVDCAAASLIAMREFQFASRFVRDVGLYDDNNQLFCTTGVGLLPTPFASVGGLAIKGGNGALRTIWFDAALRLGNGNFSATVIQQGRFSVVIDPYATDEVYRTGAHLFWARLYDGVPSLITNLKNPPPPLLEVLTNAVQNGQSLAGYSTQHAAFLFSDSVPGTSLYVQSYGDIADFLQWRTGWTWGAGILSLLIGHLAFWSMLPMFLKLGTLSHRVGSLLYPEHLICLFQPIVALDSGRCVGCEVLMRLQDGPTVVYPDQALPYIMAQGLTWELDRAVIVRALGDLAAVLPKDAVLKVALNVFPVNVRFDDLHPLIQQRMAELGVTGWTINIEVIEQDYDPAVIAEVQKLKDAGYLVSVDDFGTGYSNLGSIKTLSPNFLKIDKSFVFDMEDASLRSSLIPEIVGIARAVGSQVVAEGVEKAIQAEQLKGFGVQLGQGYWFARPMAAEAFGAYWREHGAPTAAAALATAPGPAHAMPLAA